MSRFLSLTIFFVIISGAIVHFGFEIPYISPWIGELPGDLAIHKGNVTIYLPLASSIAASLALTLIGSLFSSSK